MLQTASSAAPNTGSKRSAAWLIRAERLDSPNHPHCAGLLRYWRELPRTDGRPCRADLRPEAIGPLLPNLFLVRWSGAAEDYEYTLIGTEIVQALGVDATGETVGNFYIDPGERSHMRELYSLVSRDGHVIASTGMFDRSRLSDARLAEIAFEAVLLPMRGWKGEPMILGGMFFMRHQMTL